MKDIISYPNIEQILDAIDIQRRIICQIVLIILYSIKLYPHSSEKDCRVSSYTFGGHMAHLINYPSKVAETFIVTILKVIVG